MRRLFLESSFDLLVLSCLEYITLYPIPCSYRCEDMASHRPSLYVHCQLMNRKFQIKSRKCNLSPSLLITKSTEMSANIIKTKRLIQLIMNHVSNFIIYLPQQTSLHKITNQKLQTSTKSRNTRLSLGIGSNLAGLIIILVNSIECRNIITWVSIYAVKTSKSKTTSLGQNESC